jgi:hypothetical protein
MKHLSFLILSLLSLPFLNAEEPSGSSDSSSGSSESYNVNKVPTKEKDYFDRVRPMGQEFEVKETIRIHHDSSMDSTQCRTSGRTEDVVGVDNTLFGAIRDGEVPDRCGHTLKLRFVKNDGSEKIAYGRLTDRIWQNGGAGFVSADDMEQFRMRAKTPRAADTRAHNFYDQLDLSEQLHRKLGGRDGVNLDYDGKLYMTICPSKASEC